MCTCSALAQAMRAQHWVLGGRVLTPQPLSQYLFRDGSLLLEWLGRGARVSGRLHRQEVYTLEQGQQPTHFPGM